METPGVNTSKLSSSDLNELADLAIVAACEAGRMVAQSRPGEVQRKAGAHSFASQVVTEIDRRSEQLIVDVLTPTLKRFGLGLLAEEQYDDGSRMVADYFWCIDPLDGTLSFIEDSPGYAVSVALVRRDGAPQIGVVYDPTDATLLHAVSDAGAFHNGVAWPADPQPDGEVLSVFADRSFLDLDDHDVIVESLDQIAQDMGLGGHRLHTGRGAVMNACGVLSHPPACYFKNAKPVGGGSLWDFAATACLFREVGAVATDISGRPLDLNRKDSTFMNHHGVLFATDDALATQIQALHPVS